MVYKKALSDTDKNATKNRRKPAVFYCKYWKLCSVSAESEIGDSNHKTEAEKDQTIGEAVENVAGFLWKMNVEGQIGRGAVCRVRLGNRDFTENGFAQGGDDPVRQGGGYIAEEQGKGSSDFRYGDVSQPGNGTAERNRDLCQKRAERAVDGVLDIEP